MKRDEAMLEYYRVFAKQIKSLPPEPELSDFHHPSENQENGNHYCCSGYRHCNICPIQVP